MKYHRRKFLQTGLTLAAGAAFYPATACTAQSSHVVTVTGNIPPDSLGLTLAHEHVMVDFIGAALIKPGRYNADEVFSVALPHFRQLKSSGCKTFIDCTPAWLGRDVHILRRLSKETGIQIITNTGFYGAAGEKYLPDLVKTSTPAEIAGIWIKESKTGIENSSVKPGFMKLGLDALPFSESIRKIIEAAAITHRETKLPIGIHTSKGGEPASEELRLLESFGVKPEAWIWIHAQNEPDLSYHVRLARSGGWISFDGISKNNIKEYLERLNKMKKENLLHKILVSQDAGWYNIGTPGGGNFRPYTDFFTDFLPALRSAGFTSAEITQLTERNPGEAFSIPM